MATRLVDKNGNEALFNTDGSLPVTGVSGGVASNVTMTPGTVAKTTADAASLVVKNAAGTLYGFNVTNAKASAQYIQVHNTTSLPADAQVPVESILVPANTSVGVSYGERGVTYGTGITICNSSTRATKTIGSADCWIVASYV